MALQDWEKTGTNEWHKFSKNGKRLAGKKFYDGIMIVKTINGDWTFGSMYRQIPKNYEYKEGRLKTREQALALAKRYMRGV